MKQINIAEMQDISEQLDKPINNRKTERYWNIIEQILERQNIIREKLICILTPKGFKTNIGIIDTSENFYALKMDDKYLGQDAGTYDVTGKRI